MLRACVAGMLVYTDVGELNRLYSLAIDYLEHIYSYGYNRIKDGVPEEFSKRLETPERPKKMTNGDRIRNMTDEELANAVVSGELDACTHCEFYDGVIGSCNLDNPCVKELAYVELLVWIQSDSERPEKPSPLRSEENSEDGLPFS